MIVLVPVRDDAQQRSTAVAGASLLLVVTYFALRITPLPAFESSGQAIRSLDPLFVERFAVPEPAEALPDAERVSASATAPALEQEVGAAIDELERRFAASSTASAPTSTASGETRADAGGISADAERFDALFGAGPALPPPGRDRAAPDAVATSRRNAVEFGTRIAGTEPTLAEGRGAAAGAPSVGPTVRAEAGGGSGRRGPPPESVTIRSFEPERLADIGADRLAGWMRAHAQVLPVGVRVHLGHQPAFLTSAVALVAGPREFELFLMYNTALRELHILLVEGDRSVYLIDRGFQEATRSLREGTVRRLAGEIVAVDSRASAASSERAREFYGIFLSWWERTARDASR
ncbi:MAG: hypothetical protein ACKVS7_07135 [Gemmatimonadaceae bacterium]